MRDDSGQRIRDPAVIVNREVQKYKSMTSKEDRRVPPAELPRYWHSNAM